MKKILLVILVLIFSLEIIDSYNVNAGFWYYWEGLLEYWKCNNLAKEHFILEKENGFWDYNCFYFIWEGTNKIFMIDIKDQDSKFWIRSIYFGTNLLESDIEKYKNKNIIIDWGITWTFEVEWIVWPWDDYKNWIYAFSEWLEWLNIWESNKKMVTFEIKIGNKYDPSIVSFNGNILNIQEDNIDTITWDYWDWVTEERSLIVPWYRYSTPWVYEILLIVKTIDWEYFIKSQSITIKSKINNLKIKSKILFFKDLILSKKALESSPKWEMFKWAVDKRVSGLSDEKLVQFHDIVWWMNLNLVKYRKYKLVLEYMKAKIGMEIWNRDGIEKEEI